MSRDGWKENDALILGLELGSGCVTAGLFSFIIAGRPLSLADKVDEPDNDNNSNSTEDQNIGTHRSIPF